MQRKKIAKKGRVLDPHFEEERKSLIKPILPKNERQRDALFSIRKNILTVLTGSAGVGKTYLAAVQAANMYLQGEIDCIILTRPPRGMGETVGLFPGTVEEKMAPWLSPIISILKDQLGEGKVVADMGRGIKILPMECLRGSNISEKQFLIVDEAQNCKISEMRGIMTRLCEGSKAVLCGDTQQNDLGELSGLTYCEYIVNKHSLPDCGIVSFTADDVVRSGLCGELVKIFDQEGSVSNVEKHLRRI